MVWPRFRVFWFSKDDPKGHSERKRKKRQTLPGQLGRLKSGRDGNGLLRTHLRCPNDLERLRDRIEQIDDYIHLENDRYLCKIETCNETCKDE